MMMSFGERKRRAIVAGGEQMLRDKTRKGFEVG
jgi:hypothetical protein